MSHFIPSEPIPLLVVSRTNRFIMQLGFSAKSGRTPPDLICGPNPLNLWWRAVIGQEEPLGLATMNDS